MISFEVLNICLVQKSPDLSSKKPAWRSGALAGFKLHLVPQRILVKSVGAESQKVFECQVPGERGEALPERLSTLLLDDGAAAIVDTCRSSQGL